MQWCGRAPEPLMGFSLCGLKLGRIHFMRDVCVRSARKGDTCRKKLSVDTEKLVALCVEIIYPASTAVLARWPETGIEKSTCSTCLGAHLDCRGIRLLLLMMHLAYLHTLILFLFFYVAELGKGEVLPSSNNWCFFVIPRPGPMNISLGTCYSTRVSFKYEAYTNIIP